jgi:hypothetical protein
MAYEIANYAVKVTREAGADLSALQYTFVKQNSSSQVVAVAAATDIPIGVLQNAPLSGEEAEILVVGGTKLKAGATITQGTHFLIGTTSTGTATPLAAGTDTTKYVVASPLSSAASGDIMSALVNCVAPSRAS